MAVNPPTPAPTPAPTPSPTPTPAPGSKPTLTTVVADVTITDNTGATKDALEVTLTNGTDTFHGLLLKR